MIAWAALIAWPFVTAVLFRAATPATALSVALIGGYLLLPERTGLDLPGLPNLDKYTIPALSALLAALVLTRRPEVLRGWLPRDRVILVCLALFVLGGIGTVLTNTDPATAGRFRPGLRLYDGLSYALTAGVGVVPFLLARRYLSTEAAMARFLVIFLAAACGYAFLALYEVRMSPQLNNMVYGFFPHSWLQHVRGGGFRPLVFLEHGLKLAIFLTMAVVIAAGLMRQRRHPAFALAALWLFGTLVLAKSLGALLIALVVVPAAIVLTRRGQLLAAACIAAVILVYPPIRSAGLVPTDRLISVVETIDPGRAASFRTRVDSERFLLDRAAERPIFGWGGYGRERPYDAHGREQSISDGFP